MLPKISDTLLIKFILSIKIGRWVDTAPRGTAPDSIARKYYKIKKIRRLGITVSQDAFALCCDYTPDCAIWQDGMLHKSFAHAIQRFDTQDFRGIIDRKKRLCYNADNDEQRRSSVKDLRVCADDAFVFLLKG